MGDPALLPYLPDELWLQIFSKLRPLDWCNPIPFVSRRWRTLSSDPWLWRRVDFGVNLGWIEFPVDFLRAKLPLYFLGRGDETKVSSAPSSSCSPQEMVPGFMRPACFAKALKKLSSASPDISSLSFPDIRLVSDPQHCTCSYSHAHGLERYRERGKSGVDVLGSDAAGIFAALAGFHQLRELSLCISFDLAGKFLSLPHSNASAVGLAKNLKRFSLTVGVWTEFPDEEIKWKACRSIGAFLPQWSSCLKSFKIIGNLTTPQSTSAWETLSSSVPLPSTSSSSEGVFDTLSLDGVVTSTDCLASHFSETTSSNFFARLVYLDIRLRGDYSKIGLPLKACSNLLRCSLAYEYFSDSTPFQIVSTTNPFENLSASIVDLSLEWARESRSPFDGDVGKRILLDFILGASACLTNLDRLSLFNFDVSHLNQAVDESPGIMRRLWAVVVGFSAPEARANWEALRKVVTNAIDNLRHFHNSSTEGNRFQNFTPFRFDSVNLASLTLHNSVFALLPAFPNVTALNLPMVKNGDMLMRILEQLRRQQLRVLSAADLAFTQIGLDHLADICGSSLEELTMSRASGLRADENVSVFLRRFKSLRVANVSFDVHGKSVVDEGPDELDGESDVLEEAGMEGDALDAVSNLTSGISSLVNFTVLWWEKMNENFLPSELERELDEAFPLLKDIQMHFKPPVLAKGCAAFSRPEHSTKVLRAKKNCLGAPVNVSVVMEANY